MKPLRYAAAGLVWVLACLLGLVGALLCVTVILIPVGWLVISLARRLFRLSTALVLPREVRHPLASLGDAGVEAGEQARKKMRGVASDLVSSQKSLRKSARKRGHKAAKSLPGRRRRVLGFKV